MHPILYNVFVWPYAYYWLSYCSLRAYGRSGAVLLLGTPFYVPELRDASKQWLYL